MRVVLLMMLCSVALADGVRFGADLSFVPKLENHGAEFTRAGYEQDALELFRGAGVDVVRVRLWHTPSEPWSGLDSVIAFAERAQTLGFKLLLDIHYSDTWADPQHQTPPAAWQSLTLGQLEDSVYSYTNSVVRRFQDAQVLPDAIQIGNEIGAGFLWPTGRVGGAYDTPQQWTQFTDLLKAAIAGARDSLNPTEWPEIVLHHQEGGDAAACEWFFTNIESRDVPFDVIGLSYYPWWHGTLEDLTATIENLTSTFAQRVDVVETAYPYMTGWCDNETNIIWTDTPLLPEFPATEAGQASYFAALRDLLNETPNHGTPLMCVWEPAWIPAEGFGSPWENTAWFTCSGAAQPVFDELPGLTPQGLTIVRLGNDLRLRWIDDASLFYRVYADSSTDGDFTTLLGSTSDYYWLLPNEYQQHSYRYFVVRGSATP